MFSIMKFHKEEAAKKTEEKKKVSKIFLYFGEETLIITIDRDKKRKSKDLTGGD